MKAPRETKEVRELIADPTSVGEDGKLRAEVHALIEVLYRQIGQARTLETVRDPSGGN